MIKKILKEVELFLARKMYIPPFLKAVVMYITGPSKADAEKVGADAEKDRADDEKVRADAEKVRADAEKVKADALIRKSRECRRIEAYYKRIKAKQLERALNQPNYVREAEHITQSNSFYLKQGDDYADKCAKDKQFRLWLSGMRDYTGKPLNIRGTGINRKGGTFPVFERPYDVFRDMPLENQADTFERWCRGEDVIPILCDWLSNTSEHGKGGHCRHN